VMWHLEGDRNIAYFNKIIKIKNTTKLITMNKDGENSLTEPNQIASHASNNFKNLFCTNIVLQDHSLKEEAIPNLIENNMHF